MSGGEALFHGKRGLWILGGAAASLAVTIAFGLFSDAPLERPSPESDSFSRSALGHRALVEMLEAGGLPVQVSRYRSEGKAGPQAPLVLLEPAGETDAQLAALGDMLKETLTENITVVVVLPKWKGEGLASKPGWIGSAALRPLEEIEAVLGQVLWLEDTEGTVDRASPEDGWNTALGFVAPEIDLPQVVAPGLLEPLVWHDGGVLLGGSTEEPLYVLADPDVLNTHGLGRGDNAVLAHRLLVDLFEPSALVVDETLHGYLEPPSIWQEMLEPPLVTFSLHLAALLGLVAWGAARRFGAPQPVPPRLAEGQLPLIDNTAKLLALGRHHAYAAENYLRLTVRRAAKHCALPAGLSFEEQTARLAALGEARGLGRDLAALARQARTLAGQPRDARRAFNLCRALHAWRKELTHGA